jgi:GAF domain-containing protein
MTTPNLTPPSEQATVKSTTPGLQSLAATLEAIAEKLGVKSVLIMRSDPSSMVVAATAGEASVHYPVGGVGQKAGDATDRVPLYCERVVDSGETLFVRDSRADEILAGNEDETAFGLSNYLGVPVRNPDGTVLAELHQQGWLTPDGLPCTALEVPAVKAHPRVPAAAVEAARQERDEAWMSSALAAIRQLAQQQATLTSDDVWAAITMPPRQSRMIGNALAPPQRAGAIETKGNGTSKCHNKGGEKKA